MKPLCPVSKERHHECRCRLLFSFWFYHLFIYYFHCILFSSSYTALAVVSHNTGLVLWCILWELHRVPVLGWLCVWEPSSGTEVPAVRALGSLQKHFTSLQWDPALSWPGGLQLQSRCFRPPWQSSDTRHIKDEAQTLSLQLSSKASCKHNSSCINLRPAPSLLFPRWIDLANCCLAAPRRFQWLFDPFEFSSL